MLKRTHTTKHNITRRERGYALLLSVLVASITLTIGLGTASIIEKSLVLSSTARESQFAFYAADSGGECVLYWDRTHAGFTETVFATSTTSSPPPSGVVCAGEDIAQSWTITDLTANTAKTTFDLTLSNGTCVTTIVSKENGGLVTKVESRGYNTCVTTHPRRVERGLRVQY